MNIAPYLLAVVGMFLALHFHRGRPLFVFIILLAFYWFFRTFLGNSTSGMVRQMIIQAAALLIPVNIAVFTLMRERGIFSTAGRLRFGFLALQAGTAYWLFRNYFIDFEPYITYRVINVSFFDNSVVPQPVLILTVVCAILTGVAASVRQAPIDSGFLGALIALFIAYNGITAGHVTTSFCTAAALILMLSILQDSYNMAFRDDLTGIPSRRALNEHLLAVGRQYTIAMVDIDHFKSFNDTYGHDVGDQVLKLVAKKLTMVGGGGKAFRYGGEEFTILFRRKRKADVLQYLEELRKTIAEYSLTIRSEDRPKEKLQGQRQRGSRKGEASTSVTVSIGVSECCQELPTAADVIKAADKALYKAKNRGRNQVCG